MPVLSQRWTSLYFWLQCARQFSLEKSSWPCERPRPSFTHRLQSASWVVLMCYCDAQQFAGIMDGSHSLRQSMGNGPWLGEMSHWGKCWVPHFRLKSVKDENHFDCKMSQQSIKLNRNVSLSHLMCDFHLFYANASFEYWEKIMFFSDRLCICNY